ncbi:hypothetical protein HMN09_01143000 [Mycena chlorophos]|uniref:Calcineurin-like phosphoesterase domain-containing protein n=1 Tax=Mycena chlorophos TaxID=658473 RepID=A0A8H6S8L5_MYCCL|nr:hypothetical protein HMN09_01143000 [Mycena chlorophos]
MRFSPLRAAGALTLGATLATAVPQAQTPFLLPDNNARRLPSPSRPLQWGDINTIATTDTHGWFGLPLLQPEPNYSGTWRDYASFVTHMQRLAEEKDVDLLLLDSGDMHDGTGPARVVSRAHEECRTGLADGFPPGDVDARASGEFFKQIPYDVLSIGNHELRVYANTLDMHTNFAMHYEGRYLTSNVNITVFDEDGQAVSVPVGSRYRKFTIKKSFSGQSGAESNGPRGRSVTAFGIMFDFTTNAVNTTVQPVEELVKESWFLDTIVDEPDLFLLVGHNPVEGRSSNWQVVFDTIRKLHPTTPITIFGGHLHIRDCVQLDDRSMSLASGRYMETVGWMSVDLDKDGTGPLNLSRRYLDANPTTYMYHTGTNEDTFFTDEGKNITEGLYELEKRFGLTYQYGVAPRDYTLTRDPYPSNGSLPSLIAEEVAPFAISTNTTRVGIPFVLIVSTGSERFDIFKGGMTKNDVLTTYPFVNNYFYVADVPYAAATAILPTMNNDGPERRQQKIWRQEMEVERGYQHWLAAQAAVSVSSDEQLTLGYTTSDSCPGIGDDIPHAPLPFYAIPSFTASRTPDASNAVIDLVFDDFFRDQILKTLNKVQSARVYTLEDVVQYTQIRSNEVLGIYAEHNWN